MIFIEKISKFIVERVIHEIIVRLFLKEFSRPPPHSSLVPEISFYSEGRLDSELKNHIFKHGFLV
jgi:hypothetical protein